MAEFLYRHFNESGELLYIGVTNSLVKRIGQHEEKDWFDQVRTIKVEQFSDRASVLAAEVSAIQTEAPRFNVRSQYLARKALPVKKPFRDLLGLSQREKTQLKKLSHEVIEKIQSARQQARDISHRFGVTTDVIRHVRGEQIERELHDIDFQEKLDAYFVAQENAARKEWAIICNYLKSKAA